MEVYLSSVLGIYVNIFICFCFDLTFNKKIHLNYLVVFQFEENTLNFEIYVFGFQVKNLSSDLTNGHSIK